MGEIDWWWLLPTALSAGAGYFSYKAGKAQSQQLKADAAAKEIEAKVADLGVKQLAGQRMAALVADLGAIRTQFATRNVEATSGSAVAAQRGYERESLDALFNDVLSARYQGVGARSAARGLRMGSSAALASGYAGALSNIAQGWSSFAGGGGLEDLGLRKR
jgi:hypothetical protein